MSIIQHVEALKVLELIRAAAPEGPVLTYRTVAVALGRDPSRWSRAIAQVCDLLDAAAAHAEVPALALVRVRNAEGEINPSAWKKNVPPGLREAIIARAQAHHFTDADITAIREALGALSGLGNRAAWRKVRADRPPELVYLSLAEGRPTANQDAVNDIGTDDPIAEQVTGIRFRRDPKVRGAAEARAQGRCEYCGSFGFKRPDGSHYVETHHIIALAHEGADRIHNVIALCPSHHREAHFGANRQSLEAEFIAILTGK
jgi:5-methylcytosine-specific restriction endonuclease McrA/alkylated DNA nucleotide flippase Atl1